MLKKMKKKFRKQAILGTVTALTLSGALQTGVHVKAENNPPPPSVELVAASQNGVVNTVQGTTINFNIIVSIPANINVDASVSVDTKYYLNSDGSITSNTPSTAQKFSQNGTFTIPASVIVAPNFRTGNVTVPISVTITNSTTGMNNKSQTVNNDADTFTVNVLPGDTTAPVVTISSPIDNGYYKSSTLPAAPQYSVQETNSHTESVSGWDTSAGTHTVTVTSTDAAGNVGSASATYTVDNTAPTISTTLVDGGIYNASALQNLGKYYSVQDVNLGTDSATTLDTSEGDHTATVTATDKAGNTATKTINYTVDNTAPTISFKFNDNGFYKSSFLSSLNPYYKVEDAHLDSNGVTAPALNLNEGNQSVTVSATDLAGNSNSAKASYIVDDTAPTVSIILDPTKYYKKSALDELGDYYSATDTNLLNVDASSLEKVIDGTYQATVTAVDKAGNETSKTVSYNVDNTKPAITINDKLQNGGFYKSSALEDIKNSFYTATDAHLKSKSNVELDLTEGQHSVTVSAVDEAGNETTKTISYTIDNTAPEVSFNILANSFLTSQDLEELLNGDDYYNASDKNAVVSIVADELDLTEGTHKLSVIAKDAAGNETSKSLTYTIDNTDPEIGFNIPDNSFLTSQALESLLNGEDYYSASDNLSTVSVDADELNLDEGKHTLKVVAKDAAGNETSNSVTYTIDNTHPQVSFNIPDNSFFTSKALESLLNGGDYYSASDKISTVSVNADKLNLDEGKHTLTVVAEDAAGNKTEGSVTYTIDNTAPKINFTDNQTFILGQTASINWTASDANLQSPASATVSVDTSTVGPKTTVVSVIDKAGNTTNETIHYNVVYNYGGILQPINSNGNSVFKSGSTVPVKFQLKDGNGAFVSDAVAGFKCGKISNTVLGTDYEVVSTSAATTGSYFRYDAVSNQYIFNLNTKGFDSGSYVAYISLNDGTLKTVTFSIK